MGFYEDLLKNNWDYDCVEQILDQYIDDYGIEDGIKGLSFLSKCLDRYLYLFDILNQSDE